MLVSIKSCVIIIVELVAEESSNTALILVRVVVVNTILKSDLGSLDLTGRAIASFCLIAIVGMSDGLKHKILEVVNQKLN